MGVKTLKFKNKLLPILKSDLLIVLPAFNEGTVIEKVIHKIRILDYHNICVINDGSYDDTVDRSLGAGALVLSHPINRGPGAAVQTGLEYARNKKFRYVLLMDSDGQHLPTDIEKLCQKMERSNADIIVGNRFILDKNLIPTKRILYNKIASVFTNLFCNQKYTDTQSGFRLLNSEAIKRLDLKNPGFGFCSEMLISASKNKLKVEETAIEVLYTEYSMSKGQNLLVGCKTAFNIFWRIIFS